MASLANSARMTRRPALSASMMLDRLNRTLAGLQFVPC
jgi:hypothetical protein